jgi:hypothetical protein
MLPQGLAMIASMAVVLAAGVATIVRKRRERSGRG